MERTPESSVENEVVWYEVWADEKIDQTAEKMVRLAKKKNTTVKAKHNEGIELVATPDSNPEDIVKEYWTKFNEAREQEKREE